MKIAVIGTGYVGLVSGTCFAEFGVDVVCVDKDKKKIDELNNGSIPIFEPGLESLVKKQAALAKLARLDGIVCSGHEARFIKKICKGMAIVTPGIRLRGDDPGDQKRVMTPKEAFKNGATAIVMGRSITKGNIKNNIQKLIKSL